MNLYQKSKLTPAQIHLARALDEEGESMEELVNRIASKHAIDEREAAAAIVSFLEGRYDYAIQGDE